MATLPKHSGLLSSGQQSIDRNVYGGHSFASQRSGALNSQNPSRQSHSSDVQHTSLDANGGTSYLSRDIRGSATPRQLEQKFFDHNSIDGGRANSLLAKDFRGSQSGNEAATVNAAESSSYATRPGNELRLEESLEQLARLMANVTDAYTAAIFIADSVLKDGALSDSELTGGPQMLELTAYHTLSREIVPQARIAFGSGLIGWTAENGVRISVCPFEHDAKTLLFYSVDQALKSFIALPIVDDEGTLLGVLSCDSKKSYAFAKVTEKILIDCAAQISHLISLHTRLKKKKPGAKNHNEVLTEETNREVSKFLDHLRSQPSEARLLAEAANLPQDFVERDALVIVSVPPSEWKPATGTSALSSGNSIGGNSSSAHSGMGNVGAGVFPSPTNQPRVSNRLMELVCRHKRVLCGDRNVQALTQEEKLQRSFLSIPFRVTNREAGSLNLLSPAFGSFTANEIGILERVAEVLGRELELHRLRERHVSVQESAGLLPWRVFSQQASHRFQINQQKKVPSSLIRVRIACLPMLEDCLGVEAAHEAYHQLLRLVEQVKGSGNLGCYLVGTDCLLFVDGLETERMLTRFKHLLSRLEIGKTDASAQSVKGAKVNTVNSVFGNSVSGNSVSMTKLGEELKRGIFVASVSSPRDGETFDVLVGKSLRMMERTFGAVEKKANGEDFSNAVCW